jgi:hypothetical protein
MIKSPEFAFVKREFNELTTSIDADFDVAILLQ